jgi:hypothetical protein
VRLREAGRTSPARPGRRSTLYGLRTVDSSPPLRVGSEWTRTSRMPPVSGVLAPKPACNPAALRPPNASRHRARAIPISTRRVGAPTSSEPRGETSLPSSFSATS